MSTREEEEGESVHDRRLTEDTPLLPPEVTPDEPPHLYRQNATILCFACIFLLELSIGIMTPAWNKIMEDVICNEYLPVTSGPDLDKSRCKSNSVQERLAELRGWQATFDCIPAIICGIPYGILADRIGRKPVLFLSWLGLLLSLIWLNSVLVFSNILPLSLVWFSAVFTFIGGFPSVGPAMIYTIIGDVTPQAERASCYFLLNAIFLGAELLSNPTGAYFLATSDWLPLGLGMGLILFSGALLIFLPETLRLMNKTGGAFVDPESSEVEPAKPGIWQRIVLSVRDNAVDTWTFVLGNKRVVLLMLPMAFFVVGRFVQELLLQYATKRYHWEWTTAAYLLTIRSTANLILQLFLLPAISTFCVVRLRVDPISKDLWIARISGITITVGAIMIAFSATPWMLCISLVVFSLGCGFAAVLRSLLNAFVESHHQAIMNSLLGILQYAGLMVAGPVLFKALETGFKLGGPWIGLPFICAAMLCGTGTMFVFIFRLPRKTSAT